MFVKRECVWLHNLSIHSCVSVCLYNKHFTIHTGNTLKMNIIYMIVHISF